MMKHKKIIFPIIGVVIAAVIALSCVQIYLVNNRFPNPTIVAHSLNEVVNGGDTSLSILDSQLIDGVQLKQMLPDYDDLVENPDRSKVRDDQIKTLLIHAKLINNTSDTQKMVLVQMYAESLIWYNGIDAGIYPLLNPNEKNPMEIVLQPNQEIEVTLPYTMYEFQFQSKDWANINQRKFDLVLSFYPEKHIVNLN